MREQVTCRQFVMVFSGKGACEAVRQFSVRHKKCVHTRQGAADKRAPRPRRAPHMAGMVVYINRDQTEADTRRGLIDNLADVLSRDC